MRVLPKFFFVYSLLESNLSEVISLAENYTPSLLKGLVLPL